MPGRYSSRATKFLFLDGARMTGESGPLTKSESETELLTETFMPEGSKRPVVVQSGLANDMITLEGYARRDSGAANLILSDDAHTLAATPERMVTIGDFGDIVGQKATIHRAMSLAESWKTIPGELLLQFSGTLKTARGQAADVQEGAIIRAMRRSIGADDANEHRGNLISLGPASANGFVIGYHIENVSFKDWGELRIAIATATSLTGTITTLASSRVTIPNTVIDREVGPLAFWIQTTGSARAFVAPSYSFGAGLVAVARTTAEVTYHCAVARL